MRQLIKGWLGEKMTAFGVWLKLDPEVCRRIHNVILPARNGTTKIDHIVVSIYGLFLIETKNMDGWIFGSAQQETWTQQFFTKKVDPCLHLKSSKDLSLEIFEHARSHNTGKCVGTTEFEGQDICRVLTMACHEKRFLVFAYEPAKCISRLSMT